jgi:hypothetical protein
MISVPEVSMPFQSSVLTPVMTWLLGSFDTM